MSCLSLELKGVQNSFTKDELTNILEANLKAYYDWALLAYMGGWNEVNISNSGVYGDFSVLRPVSDPNYDDGQVWEGFRKDWVYESNVDYIDQTGGIQNPNVAAPTVNGIGATGYYIDYPNGQVIFSGAISTSATVKSAYSYRNVQIYKLDDAPWFKQIQYGSNVINSPQYLQTESGIWSLFAQNRVQLPAVVIEAIPRGGARGWELGSDALIASRDIQFNIVSENRWDRNNLMDIFSLQTDRAIWLFNNNTVNNYPLDYRGSLTGSFMYPYFVSESGFRYATCTMGESFIQDIREISPNLYVTTVRTNMEIII